MYPYLERIILKICKNVRRTKKKKKFENSDTITVSYLFILRFFSGFLPISMKMKKKNDNLNARTALTAECVSFDFYARV